MWNFDSKPSQCDLTEVNISSADYPFKLSWTIKILQLFNFKVYRILYVNLNQAVNWYTYSLDVKPKKLLGNFYVIKICWFYEVTMSTGWDFWQNLGLVNLIKSTNWIFIKNPKYFLSLWPNNHLCQISALLRLTSKIP